jgi:hypothetical protein
MKPKIFKITKTVFIIAAFFSIQALWAQAPQKMSYQAVVRNSANELIANGNVGIKISILQSSPVGTVVFSETHTAVTNVNGLTALEIGGGTLVSGDFSTINWANGPYFIKTETDPLGGTNYTIVGTSQLLSVPYAQFASKTNPSYPAVLTSQGGGSSESLRNVWVDCPGVSVIVPETGKYLLTFHGNVDNNSVYYSFNTGADSSCYVKIGVVGGIDLFSMVANKPIVDQSSSTYAYLNMQPSRSKIVSLVAGTELRVQYNMFTFGVAPSNPWQISYTELAIMRVGEY